MPECDQGYHTVETRRGLRVLRSRADDAGLRLSLEGLGGRTYELRIRSPRRARETDGVKVIESAGRDAQLLVRFEGPADAYIRREIMIPLVSK